MNDNLLFLDLSAWYFFLGLGSRLSRASLEDAIDDSVTIVSIESQAIDPHPIELIVYDPSQRKLSNG
jgi:hypothetical protein